MGGMSGMYQTIFLTYGRYRIMTMPDIGKSYTITKEQIPMLRLHMLLSGLSLEMQGMRLTAKTRSCYSIVKSELGFKGNKQKVYDQLTEYINNVQANS